MQVEQATETAAERSRLQAGTTIITKRFTFDSAHYLPNVPEGHKCGRMHGHTYIVWVHVTGPVPEREGWVVDFSDLKADWQPLQAELDHRTLNDLPGLENPTAENLAAWIWRRLDAEASLPAEVRVSAVEVAETPDSRALYVAPGQRPWVPGHPGVELPVEADTPVSAGANGGASV